MLFEQSLNLPARSFFIYELNQPETTLVEELPIVTILKLLLHQSVSYHRKSAKMHEFWCPDPKNEGGAG
jgi:hypothetical protein